MDVVQLLVNILTGDENCLVIDAVTDTLLETVPISAVLVPPGDRVLRIQIRTPEVCPS